VRRRDPHNLAGKDFFGQKGYEFSIPAPEHAGFGHWDEGGRGRGTCTGQDSYHGEQDNDESNPTECRGTSAAEQVRAAELQILSSRPEVVGAFRED